MPDQRNMKKGFLFFLDWTRFARIATRGQNMPVFKKVVPFLFYMGSLGVIFSNLFIPQNMIKKKNLIEGVKLVQNKTKHSCLGVFPSDGQISISVYFVNLWPRM